MNPEHQEAYDRLKKAAKDKQATNSDPRPSTGKTAYEAWMTEAKIVPVENE